MLRQIRTDRRLTPEDLADRAGVDRATVYRIENLNDSYAPRIETVSALTDALGLSLADFFMRVENLTPIAELAPPPIDPLERGLIEIVEHLQDRALLALWVNSFRALAGLPPVEETPAHTRAHAR